MTDTEILKTIKNKNPPNPMQYVKDLVKPYAIEKLNEYIKVCTDCEICKNPKSYGYGNTNASVLVISSYQHAYVKECKNFFEDMVEYFNGNIEDYYFINAVSCKPLSDNILRPPLKNEVLNCSVFVEQTISIIEPLAILCVNSLATSLFNTKRFADNLKEMGVFNQVPVFTIYPIECVIDYFVKDNVLSEEKQFEVYKQFEKMVLFFKEKYPDLKLFNI